MVVLVQTLNPAAVAAVMPPTAAANVPARSTRRSWVASMPSRWTLMNKPAAGAEAPAAAFARFTPLVQR